LIQSGSETLVTFSLFRKYKKRFNSEILCAALWGVNLLIGTENGLMLLDRSGQGKLPSVLRIRIRDPMPFLPLDPGWVKSQDPG
jgi:hypothetical protein